MFSPFGLGVLDLTVADFVQTELPGMGAERRLSLSCPDRLAGSFRIGFNVYVGCLEKQGLDVIPLKLRHARMLGGGFHCVTLDIRRNGSMQRYFE